MFKHNFEQGIWRPYQTLLAQHFGAVPDRGLSHLQLLSVLTEKHGWAGLIGSADLLEKLF